MNKTLKPKKKCKYCNGTGEVDNYVNGCNFKEECQCCKGSKYKTTYIMRCDTGQVVRIIEAKK